MAESYSYNTPQYPVPAASTVSIASFEIHRFPDWMLRITLVDEQKRFYNFYYRDEEGSTATRDMIIALNKANLSTKSLERRIIEKLVADGKLAAGTINGTPD